MELAAPSPARDSPMPSQPGPATPRHSHMHHPIKQNLELLPRAARRHGAHGRRRPRTRQTPGQRGSRWPVPPPRPRWQRGRLDWGMQEDRWDGQGVPNHLTALSSAVAARPSSGQQARRPAGRSAGRSAGRPGRQTDRRAGRQTCRRASFPPPLQRTRHDRPEHLLLPDAHALPYTGDDGGGVEEPPVLVGQAAANPHLRRWTGCE